MLRYLPLLALAGCTAQTAPAEDPWDSITGDDLARIIETLADDSFEGRESGTPGGRKTTDFLAREFAARGAAPAVGDSYFQPVPLVKLTRTSAGRLDVSVGGASLSMAPSAEFIAFPGSEKGSATITDRPLVFVGHGIVAPEHDWDDYAGVDVEGAIVVILRGEPSREDDDAFFMGRELTDHYQISTKFRRAAERGAVGAILVHSEASAGWPWSLLSDGSSSQTQMLLADAGDEPKLQVTAQISTPAAERLLAATGHDFTALAEAALTAPGSTPLGATATLAYKGTRTLTESNNVLAMIEGSEAPDECVIYSAHWDHVGVSKDAGGDGIHNGAVDNATGTAALLELAEAFAMMDPAPRRTIVFFATAAEEKGLLGAQYYVENPVCPLEKTVAALNMDSHFPFGAQKAMTIPGFGFSEVQDYFVEPAARVGRVLQPDSSPEVGGFFRNDSYVFVEAGIPAIYAVGAPLDEELVEGSEIRGKYIDFVTNKYHKPADEYDPATWDMAGIEQDFRIFFGAGLALAQSEDFPNFRADLPYRKLRDDMMADGGR